jgi:enoyl-CoA hydratase/carnithine racemase
MSDDRHATLTIDRPAERVARITIDRPPVNALGGDLVRELSSVARAIGDDAGLACVLLAAKGKAFCAGADLKERREMSDDDVIAMVGSIATLTSDLAAIPVPTVAVLQGAALGGGLELALACDLRIAAQEAKLGLPECSLAIIPGAGGTQRLARLVGPARAKRWIFTAHVTTAAEAAHEGLVDAAVPAVELEREALSWANRIAACGPVALRAAKQAIDEGLQCGTLEKALEIEAQAYARTVPTLDRKEALAAFAEKRPPRFEGR